MNRVKKPKYALLIASALVILASCASKPQAPAPEPTPAPAPAPVVQEPVKAPEKPAISQEELDKLLGEAKALKAKAFDLKLFEVLPDDYQAAEALFAKGQESYDAKDAEAAKAGLEKAIAAYKDLIAKGVVEIAAVKRKEAEAMKATATKAGADTAQPERFGAADEAFAAAAGLVDQSKAEEAIAGFEDARLYYELAWKRAMATELRQGIQDKDYARWDAGNFQLADTKYQAEEGFWASGKASDRSSGIDALDEAILRFNLVIQKGREMTVSLAKEASEESRKRAEEIKANVAAKDLFAAALAQYNEGAGMLAAKDYDGAYSAYAGSQEGFEKAYAVASEKRARAENEIKAAEEATAESERKAEEAEPLIAPEPADSAQAAQTPEGGTNE